MSKIHSLIRERPVLTMMRIISALFSFLAPVTFAQSTDVYNQCILDAVKAASATTQVEEIKQRCATEVAKKTEITSEIEKEIIENKGIITERFISENRTQFDPYVITAHKQNYILPVYLTNRINSGAYTDIAEFGNNLDDIEAKFQLSLKVPLLKDHLLIEGDELYFGFTLSALWQVYSEQISKPFRETNYQPEIFYVAPLGWHPFGGNTGFTVGIEHQSNGRSQTLSRSWNRVYGGFLYEKENFATYINPWIRINEDDKDFPNDPSGDDNPDIADFMGHFELYSVYKWHDYEFSFMGRRNFRTHNGAAEFGFTFPLTGKLKGYTTLFTGYGDSLIDYDYKQNRFGLGIALTTF
ncbi:MAG: phospholipase A [Aestuariibacter sp.]